MEKVYAFTDEYGAFGWEIDNPSVSTHFIITAIIVKESDLVDFMQKSEILRKKHFQTGEIKSSKIGKDHSRRLRILADLQDIPFSIFSVCIDKKLCLENMSARGLQYKKSFYKFMNNIVHRELRRAFKQIVVVADEIGSNEYMQSFCEYVSNHQDIPSLFGDAQFSFQNSKYDVRIQIADLISGTLVLSQRLPGEQENQAADDYGNKSKNQIPRTHTTLPALGMLDQPAVEKTGAHGKDFCHSHNDFIYAAHLHNHGNIVHAIHGAGLLGEKLFNQRRNGIDHKNQSQRADQVPQHPFLCGYGLGGCPAVHKGLVEQSAAEKRLVYCLCFHSFYLQVYCYRLHTG